MGSFQTSVDLHIKKNILLESIEFFTPHPYINTIQNYSDM